MRLWLLLNSYGCGSGAENAPSLLLLRLAFVAPPNPARPRRCLRSQKRAQTPAPVRPQGLPFLNHTPLYIPLLLAPPIKPLPYSASKAGRGRESGFGRLPPADIYLYPCPPSLGNLHSSLRSWGLGWSLGDCSQDSQTPRLRPCSATLRTTATSPPPLSSLLVPGSSLPSAPKGGSPLLALLANFCEHLFFFFKFSLRSKFTLCKQNYKFT